MDLDAVAEWSRYVVVVATLGYLASWLAFCAEAGIHSRRRRTVTTAAAPERELIGVASSAVGSDAPADPPAGPPAGSSGPGDAELVQRADRLGGIGRGLFGLATLVLAVGVTMRGLGTERAPWANMYEFSITGALVASIVFLVLARTVVGRVVAVWAVLLIFMTVGLAATFLYVSPGPVQPALQSYWLVIHVGCAVIAFGLFTVGAVVSALQIVSERAADRGRTTGFGASLPDSVALDRLGYRLTAIAFPIWTFGRSSSAPSGPRCRGAGTGAGTPRRSGRSSPGWRTRPTCTPAPPPAGRARRPRWSRWSGTARCCSATSA